MKYCKEDFINADMCDNYDDYLAKHIGNVKHGYDWIKANLPEIVDDCDESFLDYVIETHDKSKYSSSEYLPYAYYFYGKKTDKVKKDFDYAWNHHQKVNQHHWQYWVLVNDKDGTKALDMPYEQILAMVCDHWAFSWGKGSLYEIFKWYDEHKKNMVLSDYTKETYESILNKIKEKLDSNEKED